MRGDIGVTLVGLCLFPAAGAGQGYVLRLNTQMQAVEYRGVLLDSIPAADTITGGTGGPITPSGYAVTCGSPSGYCSFFAPGAIQHGAPLTTTADLTVWGIGVPQLSFHLDGQLGAAIGDATAWPGTTPNELIDEAYAQYAAERMTVQVGRQLVSSRLGATGFDGGLLRLGTPSQGFRATAYGGWGLAEGVALPVTSPALNPLDDYQPTDRQLVAGFQGGWTSSRADVQFNYLREVDPSVDYFVTERVGVDVALRLFREWSVTAGADYDIAQGLVGSAEATLAWQAPSGRASATLGARRYQPDFDLWTIWGAFSPVPYTAGDASVFFAPVARLRLRASAETYQYAPTDAGSPLVPFQTSGWRFNWGATYALGARWTFDGGYNAEFGPGASERGFQGGITFAPSPAVSLGAQAGSLDEPLEFRYDDGSLTLYGVSASYQATERVQLRLDAAAYVQDEARPDAGAFDWNQVRVNATVVLLLGGGAGEDLGHLPPAVLPLAGWGEAP